MSAFDVVIARKWFNTERRVEVGKTQPLVRSVTLMVKADGAEDLDTIVAERLNDWFCEPSECVQGEGFPRGTLLGWRFGNVAYNNIPVERPPF